MNNIGAQIRAIRKANHWTLSELAARSGVSINTISSYERMEYVPNTDTTVRLLDALGYTLTIKKKGSGYEC